jgi:lipopolysaccharide exporter
MGAEWAAAGRYAQLLAPWFVVWLVSSPLSGLLSVREWQASALGFSALEFALRLGALVVGARRGSPVLAVALLSASGVVISVASIVRFLHAGHTSVRRMLRPASRLLALAAVCLAPVAIALRAGNGRAAVAVGALVIGGYYLLFYRSVHTARPSP